MDNNITQLTNNIWFTADTHFSHANIIKYCARPFDNVEGMDRTLITNWNKVVEPKDIVYHLGDFCFRNPERYLNALNGYIYFIYGNHDKKLRKLLSEKDYNWKCQRFL